MTIEDLLQQTEAACLALGLGHGLAHPRHTVEVEHRDGTHDGVAYRKDPALRACAARRARYRLGSPRR